MGKLQQFILVAMACLCLAKVKWRIKEKITGYGEDLKLLCSVDNFSIEAGPAKRWQGGPKQKMLVMNGAPVQEDADKYSMIIQPDGFILVIRNVTKTDLNVTYECTYGFKTSGKIALNIEDVFEVEPTNGESASVVNTLVTVISVVVPVSIIMVITLFVLHRKGKLKELKEHICTVSTYRSVPDLLRCAADSGQDESSNSNPDKESSYDSSLDDTVPTSPLTRANDIGLPINQLDLLTNAAGSDPGEQSNSETDEKSTGLPINQSDLLRCAADSGQDESSNRYPDRESTYDSSLDDTVPTSPLTRANDIGLPANQSDLLTNAAGSDPGEQSNSETDEKSTGLPANQSDLLRCAADSDHDESSNSHPDRESTYDSSLDDTVPTSSLTRANDIGLLDLLTNASGSDLGKQSNSETDEKSTGDTSLTDIDLTAPRTNYSVIQLSATDDQDKSISGCGDDKSDTRLNPDNLYKRIDSFRLHDYQWPTVFESDINEMAKAGFYCIGCQAKVRCFSCGAEWFWEPGNDPFNEDFHKNCLHIQE